VVKLADILANISDLKNSGFSKKEKIDHVKQKRKYLDAIHSGIILNKSKIPNLIQTVHILNSVLESYGQREIKMI
jgi:hypothetical protein